MRRPPLPVWLSVDWRDVRTQVVAGIVLLAVAWLAGHFGFLGLSGRLFANFMREPVAVPLGLVFLAVIMVGVLALRQLSFLPRPTGECSLEVRPMKFEIDLTRPIPNVEISFYAINYRPWPVVLHELRVTRFQLGSGPAFEHVDLVQEFRLDPCGASIVVSRRNLMDSEVHALASQARNQRSASLSYVARARHGDHVNTYGPVVAMAVDGWVTLPAA